MHEFLMSLLPWGTEAIIWVQGFRTPALDVFFEVITFLGEEEFYLLLFPLIYWTIHKQLGIRLAFTLLPGVYLNSGFKDLFYTPRPNPTRVVRLVEETTYAFPSGHAQNTTVLSGFLATHLRRWFAWLLAALVIVGVSLSRVYLGAHYPQDVVGGFFIGVAYLALFFWLEKPLGAWIGTQSLAVQLALASAIPILLGLLHPREGATAAMATLAGFGVAHVLEVRWIRFQTGGPGQQRALRFLVGIALTAIVYQGLKIVFPPGLVFHFVRYVCVGLTAGLVVPWVFVKTRLAEVSE